MDSPARHYYKEVRLRQMRALVEIARQGSFAKAARGLGLSCPAVWQQVRALEREFDADLVNARGGEAVLTEDGELLARLTAPLVESFDSIRALFAERRGKLHRRLTLATTTTLLTHELPPAIAGYRKARPNVELILMDRPSLEARAIFERGGADIAIVGAIAEEQAGTPSHATILSSYRFHLICPQGHPLLGRKRPTFESMGRHPLILTGKGAAVHHHVEKVFSDNAAREPQVSLTSTNLLLTIGYVQMGYGVAVTPLSQEMAAHWQPARHGGVTIRDVSHLFGEERIVMLHRSGGHELKHVREFRETVAKALGGS